MPSSHHDQMQSELYTYYHKIACIPIYVEISRNMLFWILKLPPMYDMAYV